jgi:integrase
VSQNRRSEEVAQTPRSGPQTAAGEVLSAAAREALAAGMPANTRRAYAESLQRYVEWAEAHGWQALPATPASLTEFATWAAYTRGWAPVTIERARWAVIKWHKIAGLPLPPTDGLVLVLKGYRAQLAKSGSPKAAPRKADAARGDVITAMLAPIDRTTLVGRRDAAIILVGFGIAGRRGEIASLDIERIRIESLGMQVRVYRQKTRTMDEPVIHRRPARHLCPVCATEDLIASLGRTSGPLFVRINRHGQPAHQMTRNGQPIGDPSGRMTGQAVGDVIHRRAVTAGLTGRWTGHSLRRGLATSMRRAGAEREDIERQGGWTAGSTAVAGYIEEADRWLKDVLEGIL